MFDEPNEPASELPRDPAQRAREKAEEFCLHAEIAATFEGTRKTDAVLRPKLSPELARQIQQTIARVAKARSAEHPVLPPEAVEDAVWLLMLPGEQDLPTNDYLAYRRPGEVMIVRWLQGDQVEVFYERLQAHFEAALEGCREDERHAHGWKQDPDTLAYLDALDRVKLSMADRYLRSIIRSHEVMVLSTLTADEMNIAFLAEDVMDLSPADLVGEILAPGDDPTDQDRAWFFKLFALRGLIEEVEHMCFFAFLQKTDDSLNW